MASQQQIDQLLGEWAASPPPGHVRYTIDPPTLRAYDVGLLVMLLTTSTLTVVMRLYTRWYLTKTYLTEDFIILLAWCFQWVQDFLGFRVIYYIYDRHVWDLTNAELFQGQYWVNWTSIAYGPTIVLIKVAIILQYVRLFIPTRMRNPVMFYACWGWLVVIVVFYIITTVLTILQCQPRVKIWEPWVEGHCISQEGYFVGNGIMNIVSDVVVLCLPIISLSKLKMPLKKKIALGLLFATGGLACIASILRTYWSWLVLHSLDVSWNVNIMGSIGWFEVALGIICYCLPVAPKFIRLTKQRLDQSRSRRANSAQSDVEFVTPQKATFKDNYPIISGLSMFDRTEPLPLGSMKMSDDTDGASDIEPTFPRPNYHA